MSFILYPKIVLNIAVRHLLKIIGDKHNVGPAGLEPAVHLRSGFTVHAATNYRLRAQITQSILTDEL